MAVHHLMTFSLSFLHERFPKSNNEGGSRCSVLGMSCANNPWSEIFLEDFRGTWDLSQFYTGMSVKQYTNTPQNQYTNNIKIHTLNSIGSFHKHFLLLVLKAVQLQCICAPVLFSLLMNTTHCLQSCRDGQMQIWADLANGQLEIAKEQMCSLSANRTEQINSPRYCWGCVVFFL